MLTSHDDLESSSLLVKKNPDINRAKKIKVQLLRSCRSISSLHELAMSEEPACFQIYQREESAGPTDPAHLVPAALIVRYCHNECTAFIPQSLIGFIPLCTHFSKLFKYWMFLPNTTTTTSSHNFSTCTYCAVQYRLHTLVPAHLQFELYIAMPVPNAMAAVIVPLYLAHGFQLSNHFALVLLSARKVQWQLWSRCCGLLRAYFTVRVCPHRKSFVLTISGAISRNIS